MARRIRRPGTRDIGRKPIYGAMNGKRGQREPKILLVALRQNADFLKPIKLIWVVQTCAQKYSA